MFGADGTVLHEYEKGRFNWGPPSLSVSTDGGYVAWVRWRGDAKKLCVMNLGDYGVTEYVHSLYRYAWLDDRQLVFLLGGPPRVLDAVTGEARPFLPERYAEVAVAGERVWLTSEPRDTVFECTVDGSNLEVAWREERSLADRLKRETRRVDTIVPFADDSGWILLEVYRRRYTVVRREERWVGRVRDHAGGWAPLLNCHQPDFGFMLPGD